MLQKITKRAVDQNNKNNNFETMLEYATNKAHNLLVQISNNVSPHPRLSKGFKIKVAQRRRVSMPEVIQWVARSFKAEGFQCQKLSNGSHGRSKERGFHARSYPMGRMVVQKRGVSMPEVI